MYGIKYHLPLDTYLNYSPDLPPKLKDGKNHEQTLNKKQESLHLISNLVTFAYVFLSNVKQQKHSTSFKLSGTGCFGLCCYVIFNSVEEI